MTRGKTPKISVIMSIYNQMNEEQLDSAIYSVLNQTFGDFEFIIYDDGSDKEVKKMLVGEELRNCYEDSICKYSDDLSGSLEQISSAKGFHAKFL